MIETLHVADRRPASGPSILLWLLALIILTLALLGRSAASAEQAVRSVAIERTAFRLTLADGGVLSGMDLIGVTLTMTDAKGGQVPVRIEAVRPDLRDPTSEITLYSFSVADATTGERRDLCEPDPYGERWGFPVGFGMDGAPLPQGTFAIVCTGGARAKCLRFGYRPWGAPVQGVAMRALYDACVHMVRADYCGNGVGTTRNGTKIDIYDHLGIQQDEPAPGMSFEAGWGPEGAICVAHTRIPENITLEQVPAACPRLRRAPSGEDCTEGSAKGALLFNKSF